MFCIAKIETEIVQLFLPACFGKDFQKTSSNQQIFSKFLLWTTEVLLAAQSINVEVMGSNLAPLGYRKSTTEETK